MPHRFAPLLLALALAACARAPSEQASGPAAPQPPVGVPSGQPRFFPAGDRLGLSWVDREGAEAVLRFALYDGTSWSEPVEVARGSDWFVNWADTPGVVALDTAAYAAFFLQRTGEGRFEYAVRVVRSDDGGRTWSAPVTPHRDDVRAEFGFVSALPEDGGLRLVWLDGEHTVSADGGAHAHAGPMALRTAVVLPDGRLADATVLDARVCECCPTALVRTTDGLVAAYRDRSPEEVRDVAVVRREAGAWAAPWIPHPDGWRIEGCPVNGPALAAAGQRVALAWYTGAGGGAVRVALSGDGGRTFGPALRLDEGDPIGRVGIAWAGEAAVVGWMEREADAAVLLLRRVGPNGAAAPVRLAGLSPERASGMPRLAVFGEAVWAAWVEADAVRVGRMPLDRLP